MIIGHKKLGEGPENVIVAHGWHMDHTVFEPTFTALDKDKFTYVFMDYRGYGLSMEMKGEHTIKEIGEDALGLAEHYGWDQFHLIGHSMGGMVIQWIMANAKERVKSGVAVTPVPASGVPMEGEELALFEGAAREIKNRGIILMSSTGDRHNEAWERVMNERSVVTTTPDAYADYLAAWSKTNFVEDVAGLRIPLKVLVGEYDPHITAEVMRMTIMNWFPNAELEVLQNAGHYPMLEIPVNLATICENFMWQNR
ncbi:MAG: alpha/beta hydrolase [Deltaproteobacteria bacterium]|nr:alpha/beta hydrolase [Deltaproteobacteria bacterium]